MLTHPLLYANHWSTDLKLSHQQYKAGYDYPHFTNEASEAQADNTNFPPWHYPLS